jgi:hypothetical protein
VTAGTPRPPGAKRAPITWDIVTSSVLLVVAVVIAAALTFFAFFLVFASDPCGGATACNTGQMGAGFLVALLGPAFVTLAAMVAAIVLMVLRRVSFWVPITGMVLAVLVWVVGAALVISGVPGATF